MKQAYPNLINKAILPVLIIGMISVFSACSEQYTSPLAGSYGTSAYQSEFRYPKITPEMITNGPLPGYRFLHFNNGALDNELECVPYEDQKWIEAGDHDDLDILGVVKLEIGQSTTPTSETFRIEMPLGCYGIVDCYPHPYQFYGMVEIRMKLSEMGLPAGFDYSTLVPWYVNDAGELIPVQYEWPDSDELLIRTDHFSRYIIGQRISG